MKFASSARLWKTSRCVGSGAADATGKEQNQIDDPFTCDMADRRYQAVTKPVVQTKSKTKIQDKQP